jgi:phage terminase large subunit-like protein
MIAKTPSISELWSLNRADEIAIDNGCFFSVEAGGFAVWWIERFCRLYEGEWAGEPMRLRGCHTDQIDRWPITNQFDIDQANERANDYISRRQAGEPCDWQYETTMRMFGWQRHSDRWERHIRRFRQASVWVAKKNKKTPTMSAWGLYLLCGDGESGQKVFFMSKDSKQVRENAVRHIVEMVEASPELSGECKINRVEMKITHLPTRSFLMPMSSAGANNQKSKEGLNGSAMVDETHVVDRGLMKRVDRMGISRSEPVHAEFSTAGTDPDSYGKERFDYAVRVDSGDIEDDQILTAIYAAPQELTDDDLADNPIGYGQMANPAWGHTIAEDEYLADYTRSKTTVSGMLDFKMYRLNIWQHSSSPWIKPGQWGRGLSEFAESDLDGEVCYAGLDLSSVCDFSSLCLCFPVGDDQHKYLWWYWLPEQTARNFEDKMPINEWIKDERCNLDLTPGERIDYDDIAATVRDLAKRFKIRTLAYDKYNAERLTQELTEGRTDENGNVVFAPTGIERMEFPQGRLAMNEPTKQFETAVIDGDVLHNGDPLAAWMINNATIKPDHNGNYKPEKEKRDSLRKIDGVVCAVMARAVAVKNLKDERPTYYEENEVQFI